MDEFKEVVVLPQPKNLLTSTQINSGPLIEPLTRLITYDPGEWEKFIDEWVSSCLSDKYKKVLRFSGANDRGIDIAGFADAKNLKGIWDNYQCKHYSAGIMPSEAWPEIGKLLWHSFNEHYVPPRAYFFVAPRGTGTTLTQLLANTDALKAGLLNAWDKNVKDNITSIEEVTLSGDFAAYVDRFDFSIFKPISIREILEQHRSTPYFVQRFGGGLPARPTPPTPPESIGLHESGYVTKLLDAYADHKKVARPAIADLQQWKPLKDHFHRQRESFYHAESLRVFVRDKVEPGTFESLQNEIYQGVVDISESDHPDAFECVKQVTNAAQLLPLDAHPLGSTTFVTDKRGICHQLANEDRLKWMK